MNEQNSTPWKKLQQKRLSRRNLIHAAAGSAAGAGLMLGSGLRPAFAQEAAQETCRDLPRPIPHITRAHHFFFPGPVTGIAAPTDPTGAQPNGRDPSTITDFKGVIGQADLSFSGTGTDLSSGASAPYTFHTDWRFMKGVFVGVDGLQHNGTLSFI